MTMDNVITQEATIGICALGVVFLFMLVLSLTALVRRTRGKKGAETFEPHAGKTLGL